MAVPKILFVSWHFYMDGSNGASISTRELLHAFSQYGWNVKTIFGISRRSSKTRSIN